jgi:DNA-directed RNA polymerase subunit RPC12/RpoP
MSHSQPSMPPSAGQSWTCTACGANLPIRAEHVGRKCRCDRCGLVFFVQATDGFTTGTSKAGTSKASIEISLRRQTKPAHPSTTKGQTSAKKRKPMSGGKLPPNTSDDLWSMDELWDVEDAPSPSQLIDQQPELYPIICELCQTLMYATEGQLGTRLVCPDCGRKTVAKKPPPKPIRKPAPRVEGYELDVASAPGPRPSAVPTIVRRELEQAQRERDSKTQKKKRASKENPAQPSPQVYTGSRPKMPKIPLLQGVGLMLRSGPIMVRWLVLSIGLFMIGWLVSWTITFMATPLMRSFALCLIVVAFMIGTLWMMGAAAIWLAILKDSSDGNDQLYHPPDIVFQEWMGALIYVVFAAAIAACPVSLIMMAISDAPPWLRVGVVAAAWLVGFPLVLLSMLEIGSPLAIFSPRLFASLLGSPGPWLLFYMESTLLVAGFAGASYGLLQLSPQLAPIIDPAIVALTFIYFRLLGRLAWWLSEREASG